MRGDSVMSAVFTGMYTFLVRQIGLESSLLSQQVWLYQAYQA